MKKIVRTLGLCALVMLALVSCKKKEESAVMTFRASISQPTSDAKTYLDSDHYLYWNSGDAIKVYAIDENDTTSAVFTTQDNAVKVATFSGNIAQSDNYYALYPAGMFSDFIDDETRISATVSPTQQFVPNGIATNAYLMAAKNVERSLEFKFQGLFGLLAIPMKGNVTIGSIELTDAWFDLWGDVPFKLNQLSWDDLKGGSDSRSDLKTITLECGDEDFTLSEEPDTAYFVLRPLACANGFTITVKDLAGDTLFTKSAPQNFSNAIKPQRILLMPEIEITANEP